MVYPIRIRVVPLCDRCFRVAVCGKGIILTSITQDKLEIIILLTVKSSLTSIRFQICLGAFKLTMKIYRATKYLINT